MKSKWLAAWSAVFLATAVAGGIRADDKGGGSKGKLRAERAGWMLGMLIGEERAQRFPFVTKVDPKSDAFLKGLKEGDEIYRFEDDPVDDLPEFFDRVQKVKPGRSVSLWVRRGGQTLHFDVIQPKPQTEAEADAAANADGKKGSDAKGKSDEGEKSDKKDKKDKKKRPPVVIKPVPVDR